MRLHITLADEIVSDLDHQVGSRRRSSFIADAVRLALEHEHRWELIESSFGTIAEEGHDWDGDTAAWVREQRHLDGRRVG